MWELYKQINLQIGCSDFGGTMDEPEDGMAISNVISDFSSDEAIIYFDWTGRIITTEMS